MSTRRTSSSKRAALAWPWLPLAVTLSAASLGGVACGDARELRPWVPTDHDHGGGPPPARSGASAAAAPAPRPNVDEEVVDIWSLRCAKCHGPRGAGNGPEGPMYNTPSLARPEWLATVSDAELREVITNGRGRMPPAHLSPPLLDGMIRLVRSLGSSGRAGGDDLPPGHPPVGAAAPPGPPASASATAPSATAPVPSAAVPSGAAPVPSTTPAKRTPPSPAGPKGPPAPVAPSP